MAEGVAMTVKENQKRLSRRDWLRTAASSAAGAGLVVVRPARAAAAPVSMRPAEHWETLEVKK